MAKLFHLRQLASAANTSMSLAIYLYSQPFVRAGNGPHKAAWYVRHGVDRGFLPGTAEGRLACTRALLQRADGIK